MKIQTIVENRFTELAYKLNKEVRQLGESELRDLVKSPRETVTLIQKGATSKQFVFADKQWLEKFLGQWTLLDERALEQIFQQATQDVAQKYEKLQEKSKKSGGPTTKEDIFAQELILAEGIGGFMWKLAKWTLMIIQLLAMASGAAGRYRQGARMNDDDLRILNPFAVFRLTKRLHDASVVAYSTVKVASPTTP